MNIETKVEDEPPWETAPREDFVQIVAKEIRDEECWTVYPFKALIGVDLCA